jgi:hypothetical protein
MAWCDRQRPGAMQRFRSSRPGEFFLTSVRSQAAFISVTSYRTLSFFCQLQRGNAMRTSQTAVDLIWQEETGGDDYYNHTNECRADWPGGASGVTIGGFYDCGYVTHDELRHDWGDLLPSSMIDALEGVVGITGFPARSHARELDSIVNVSAAVARTVFISREIPKWEAVVSRLPNADKLSGDSFGALVSLALNRGDHFTSPHGHRDVRDRYREMRQIHADMAAKRFDQIPALFRSMKRLWPEHSDLWNRRDHEAELFENGIAHGQG